MLSVCLQHNATLCALVLDGNPAIGPEAEERISVELETRSMMPEVRERGMYWAGLRCVGLGWCFYSVNVQEGLRSTRDYFWSLELDSVSAWIVTSCCRHGQDPHDTNCSNNLKEAGARASSTIDKQCTTPPCKEYTNIMQYHFRSLKRLSVILGWSSRLPQFHPCCTALAVFHSSNIIRPSLRSPKSSSPWHHGAFPRTQT